MDTIDPNHVTGDSMQKQKTKRSIIPEALSILVTLGYFAVLYGMMNGSFRAFESQALVLMIGSLSTSWGMVIAFWFGSTASSVRKTELIAKSPPVQ